MSDSQDLARRRRRLTLPLIVILLVFAMLELISYAVIALGPASLETDRASTSMVEFSDGAERFLEERSDAMANFHESFGWRPNVGLSNEETRINSMGLRSAREYERVAPEGVLRVAAFGDSFTYGHEVDLEDAWPTLIEVNSTNIEVLNFGVTGFGPDQAYLRFSAEAEAVHPAVVIWGISPWMVRRLVNVFRPFLTKGNEFATKPRYVLGDGESLVLLPQPIRKVSDARGYVNEPEAFRQLGEHDYFYDAAVFENPLHDWMASVRVVTAIAIRLNRRYFDGDRILTGPPGRGVFNTESEAFGIAVALMMRFDSEARALGAIPITMIIPDINSLRRQHEELPTIGSPLIEACREAGLNCWNLADAFVTSEADTPIASWFMRGGHYSPVGNSIAAHWIETQLRALQATK